MKPHEISQTLRRIDSARLTVDSLRETVVVAELRGQNAHSHARKNVERRCVPRRAAVDEVSGVMPFPAHALPRVRGHALPQAKSAAGGHLKMNAKTSIAHRTVRTVVILVAAVLLLFFLIHGAAS